MIALGIEYMKSKIPEQLWDIYLLDKLNPRYSWTRNEKEYSLKERFGEPYPFTWSGSPYNTTTSEILYNGINTDGTLTTSTAVENMENYINKIYEEKSELPNG